MKFDDLASDAEKHELATADRSGVADLVNAWCRRRQFTWFDQEHEYSALFQEMYPERRSRQRYIESKVEGAFPSWGYLYLASIVSKGYFNVAFTTNFDDLVNDALAIYLRMNPVVCAADSEVMSISITSDRPKIIKLHGDYLFERLKNTVEELEQLDPNMERKFREFAKDCGVVVLGYGGRDRSIMRVVEELLGDDEMFPLGVYWGVRRERDGTFRPASRVEELATRFALSYRMQLTNFYWFRQQPLLALPHLEAAVAIEPNSPEAHGWLGQVYLALGQLTPAQREMDIALRLSPQDVRLLVNTGILYLQLSQPDLAEG